MVHHCPPSVFRQLVIISLQNFNNAIIITGQIATALLISTNCLLTFFFNLSIGVYCTKVVVTLKVLEFNSKIISCYNTFVTLAMVQDSIHKTSPEHPQFSMMPWKSFKLFFIEKFWATPHTLKWAKDMSFFTYLFFQWSGTENTTPKKCLSQDLLLGIECNYKPNSKQLRRALKINF